MQRNDDNLNPTETVDEHDANAEHTADRPPTAAEETAAPTGPVRRSVADAFDEAAERGAKVQGEGRIG